MRALHFSPNMGQTTVLCLRRRPAFHRQSLTVTSTLGRPAATLGCAVRGRVKASPALPRCIATLGLRPMFRVLQIAFAPLTSAEISTRSLFDSPAVESIATLPPPDPVGVRAANSCASHKYVRSRREARTVSSTMLLRVRQRPSRCRVQFRPVSPMLQTS